MPIRNAEAEWKGDLKGGAGTLSSASGALSGKYSFASRFEEGTGTNPEELIGAALASCYSMALANNLAQAGHTPDSVRTSAKVHLEKTDKGQTVTKIDLTARVKAPALDAATLTEKAETTRTTCPMARALGAVQINVDAKLA
jgi:osmotically inducible protein OsmC